MSIRCVIIDDQEFAIESIKNVIDELSSEFSFEIVKCFSNSVEAVNEINNINFDLLFIDYEMPGYNGVQLVKKIKHNIPVIFVTSFNNKSIDISNEVNYAGFLTKPPQTETLRTIIINKNLALNNSKKIKKIIIPNGKKDLYFDKEEIYFIESFGETKKIYTKDKKMIKDVNISFANLEEILNHKGFEIISKKHMINISKIRERTKANIFLIDNTKLSIGETKKASFLKRLKIWISN